MLGGPVLHAPDPKHCGSRRGALRSLVRYGLVVAASAIVTLGLEADVTFWNGPAVGQERHGVLLVGTAAAEESLGRAEAVREAGAGQNPIFEPAKPWRIVASRGSNRFRAPDQAYGAWQVAYNGIELAPGADVQTGDDGVLELFNGRDRMAIGAGSFVSLPGQGDELQNVTVLQNSGTVRYKVKSRTVPSLRPNDLLGRVRRALFGTEDPKERFEVRTPYIAAIVKGTAFSVSVAPQSATLSVTEGVVGVTDLSSGGSTDVGVGETAAAAASTAGAASTTGTTGSTTGTCSSAPGKSGNAPGKSGSKGSKSGKNGKNGKSDKGGKGGPKGDKGGKGGGSGGGGGNGGK